MAKFAHLLRLMQTTMASVLALGTAVAAPTQANAQTSTQAPTEAATAYQQATEAGTVRALEQFIERFPLSPEANAAFREIIIMSRNSTVVNTGPEGLFGTASATAPVTTRGISPY